MAAFSIKCISGVLLLHIIHTYAHTDTWKLTVYRESGGAPLSLQAHPSDTLTDVHKIIQDKTGDNLHLHLLIHNGKSLSGGDVPISTVAGLRTGSELWWMRMMKVHLVQHMHESKEDESEEDESEEDESEEDESEEDTFWVTVWWDVTVGNWKSLFKFQDTGMSRCTITPVLYYMGKELADDGAMLRESGVKFLETDYPLNLPHPRFDQTLHMYLRIEECVGEITNDEAFTHTDMLQLTVHWESSGTPLSAEMSPSDTVSDLLRMVTEITGGTMLDHLLIHNGEILNNPDIPISSVSGLHNGGVLLWTRKMGVHVVCHVGEVEERAQWLPAWRDAAVGHIKRVFQSVQEMSGYETTLVAHYRGRELVDDEAKLRECGVKLWEMYNLADLPDPRPDQQLHIYLGFEYSSGQTNEQARAHTDMWQLKLHIESEATSQALTVKPSATVFDLYVMTTLITGDDSLLHLLLHNGDILLDQSVPILSVPGLRTGSELWWTRRMEVNVVLHVGEAEEKALWWSVWYDVTVGYIKRKHEMMLIEMLGYNTTLEVHYKGIELTDDSAKLRECGVKILKSNYPMNRPDLSPEQQLHIYSRLEFASEQTNTQARTHKYMWQLIVHRESGATSLLLTVDPSATPVHLERMISDRTGDDLSLHILLHNEELLVDYVPISSMSGLGTGSELWWMRKMTVWVVYHWYDASELEDWMIVWRDVTVGYLKRKMRAIEERVLKHHMNPHHPEMKENKIYNTKSMVSYMGKELKDDEATLSESGVKLLLLETDNLKDLPDPRPDQQIHIYLRKI